MTTESAAEAIRRRIRTIPDFPKPGIQFRDITTLLLDAEGLRLAVEQMVASVEGPIDLVAGIEARGFVFAPAVALALGATIAEDYALEYGTDRITIHADACAPGARVLLVDDLIATGGTARAAVRLLRKAGATVTQAAFVIDLPDLGGADALRGEGITVRSLVAYDGD